MSKESKSKLKRSLKPVGCRVLVKLKNIEKTSPGGIVFVDKMIGKEQFSTQEAHIIDIAPDAFKYLGSGYKWCEIGDCVRISRYSGDDLKDIEEDAVYRIIEDRDIYGVYND